MKVNCSQQPPQYEYNTLHDGTVEVRFYENITEVPVIGMDGEPTGGVSYEGDVYVSAFPPQSVSRNDIETNYEKFVETARTSEAAGESGDGGTGVGSDVWETIAAAIDAGVQEVLS